MIYNEEIISNSFESTLSIVQSKIYNTASSKQLIVLASTTLNVENVTFENITKEGEVALIDTNVESSVNLNNIVYRSSMGPFVQLTSSSMNVNNLTISNITSQSSILVFYTAIDAVISNVIISRI